SFSLVEKSIQNSLNFGVYQQEEQVGYARVISDFTTFAYLCDVFILPDYRGRGLSKWLITCIQEHPELQGLRRFMLMTRDAHGLYSQHGFSPLKDATGVMEITKPGIYLQQAAN
ncbi:MAG: GNAT family N-acetyltransferase, partial [Cytophagales bacterium CG18_big_fil_WC_8_21_14_2_50_42_9]